MQAVAPTVSQTTAVTSSQQQMVAAAAPPPSSYHFYASSAPLMRLASGNGGGGGGGSSSGSASASHSASGSASGFGFDSSYSMMATGSSGTTYTASSSRPVTPPPPPTWSSSKSALAQAQVALGKQRQRDYDAFDANNGRGEWDTEESEEDVGMAAEEEAGTRRPSPMRRATLDKVVAVTDDESQTLLLGKARSASTSESWDEDFMFGEEEMGAETTMIDGASQDQVAFRQIGSREEGASPRRSRQFPTFGAATSTATAAAAGAMASGSGAQVLATLDHSKYASDGDDWDADFQDEDEVEAQRIAAAAAAAEEERGIAPSRSTRTLRAGAHPSGWANKELTRGFAAGSGSIGGSAVIVPSPSKLSDSGSVASGFTLSSSSSSSSAGSPEQNRRASIAAAVAAQQQMMLATPQAAATGQKRWSLSGRGKPRQSAPVPVTRDAGDTDTETEDGMGEQTTPGSSTRTRRSFFGADANAADATVETSLLTPPRRKGASLPRRGLDKSPQHPPASAIQFPSSMPSTSPTKPARGEALHMQQQGPPNSMLDEQMQVFKKLSHRQSWNPFKSVTKRDPSPGPTTTTGHAGNNSPQLPGSPGGAFPSTPTDPAAQGDDKKKHKRTQSSLSLAFGFARPFARTNSGTRVGSNVNASSSSLCLSLSGVSEDDTERHRTQPQATTTSKSSRPSPSLSNGSVEELGPSPVSPALKDSWSRLPPPSEMTPPPRSRSKARVYTHTSGPSDGSSSRTQSSHGYHSSQNNSSIYTTGSTSPVMREGKPAGSGPARKGSESERSETATSLESDTSPAIKQDDSGGSDAASRTGAGSGNLMTASSQRSTPDHVLAHAPSCDTIALSGSLATISAAAADRNSSSALPLPPPRSPLRVDSKADLSLDSQDLQRPGMGAKSQSETFVRRNSLGDLRIPKRISQAQTGLRANIGFVKEFAQGIEGACSQARKRLNSKLTCSRQI